MGSNVEPQNSAPWDQMWNHKTAPHGIKCGTTKQRPMESYAEPQNSAPCNQMRNHKVFLRAITISVYIQM